MYVDIVNIQRDKRGTYIDLFSTFMRFKARGKCSYKKIAIFVFKRTAC